MVIYFLLFFFFFFCCIYGNFLINMEWSFIFKSKVVEMYCTVFFIIVARFSFLSRPEVSFSRESRVFVLFFHVRRNFEVAQSFLWIILLCLQPVHPIVVQSPCCCSLCCPRLSNGPAKQPSPVLTAAELKLSISLESTLSNTKPWSLRATNGHHFWLWSFCELCGFSCLLGICSVWDLRMYWCLFFFSIGLFYFEH